MSRLPRLTARGWVLTIACVVLLISGAMAGFVDLIRAAIFGLVLVIAALVLACVRIGQVQTRRRVEAARMEAGREYTVTVSLQSRRATFLPVSVQDPSALRTDRTPTWNLPHLRKGETDFSYSVQPPHRGSYDVGPTLLDVNDPFRLAASRSKHGQRSQWLVWPTISPLTPSAALVRGRGDEVLISALAHQAGAPGASIREYDQGDDMRIVHWPATAHSGELMVRQFDPPAEPMTRLVLSGDVDGVGTNPEWEWLINAMASTIVHYEDAKLPASCVIAEIHTERADEALDALASVRTCPVINPEMSATPTVLFHHTSSSTLFFPPHHNAALAFVAGPDSDEAARSLADMGWDAVTVDAKDAVGEVVGENLELFGGSR